MPPDPGESKILIVEDDFLIAFDLATQLEDAGYQVCGTAGKTDAAMEIIARCPPDIALLDVNLGQGETSCDIARSLMALNIPFAFLSGYTKTSLPPVFADVPILSKPCPFETVQEMIARLVPNS